MNYKPYKMKGSPFQRNFGIGDNESPDKESPLNNKIDWGGMAKASLAAGLSTLPGGFDPAKTKDEAETEDEGTKAVDAIKLLLKKAEDDEELTKLLEGVINPKDVK